jgi:phosphate starvation-inducible PhoH-like protein
MAKRQTQTPDLNEKDLKQITLRESQKKYFNTILENDITFCYGPAGTSKTFTACYTAIKLLMGKGVNRIILTKPIQESGEKLGHLPGDVDEKIAPYMQSFIGNLNKIISGNGANWLTTRGKIEYKPLAYMRGTTFENCLMILDEAQNADFRQLMLFLTRMGKGSKVVICGDVSQYDIAKTKVALPDFIKLMSGIKNIGTHVFEDKDIVRAKILVDVVKRYEKWKSENNMPY